MKPLSGIGFMLFWLQVTCNCYFKENQECKNIKILHFNKNQIKNQVTCNFVT